MNGHQVWKIHRAVKMHLTSDYDLFKYSGRFVRDGEEYYQKINRKKMYEILSSKLTRPFDAVEFFLSNLVYTTGDQAFTIFEWDNYKRWIRQKESLTKLICDDISNLDLENDLLDDFIPGLLRSIISEKIMPQTAVAIDGVIPILDDWKKKVYFGADSTVLKLIKLKPFCKFKLDRVELMIRETCEKV
jgi:hypothetical protein